MTPTIVIVTHTFYPSPVIGAKRVTALARYLAGAGMRVVVVSAFGGAPVVADAEILPGVVAVPVAQPPRLLLDTLVAIKRWLRGARGPQSLQADGINEAATPEASAEPSRGITAMILRCMTAMDAHKRWSWRASRAAVSAGRRYGASVVLSSGPPFSPLVAGWWSARRLRVPYIADLRDPWSDLPPIGQDRPHRSGLRRLSETVVLRSSAAVTCTAEPLLKLLQSRYPRLRDTAHLIRNGFDGAMSKRSADTGGSLSMLFAGEIYRDRDPFPVLEALERLLGRPDVDPRRVHLTFVGHCAHYKGQSLAAWLQGKRSEQSVTIQPQVPPEAVAAYIGKSTVLLNLAQRQRLCVTAKTYEHLASGRESLAVCEPDSGTAQLLAGLTGVTCVDSKDAGAMDAALLDLYERHVRQGRLSAPPEAQVAPFARQRANEMFLALIQSLTTAPTRARGRATRSPIPHSTASQP